MSSTAEEQNIGWINEYLAIAWLINQGYQVFKNVLPRGDIDLVIEKDNKIIKIDVKTLRKSDKNNDWCFSWNTYLTKEQIEKGIKILFVKDGIVGWNRDYFPVYRKDTNK